MTVIRRHGGGHRPNAMPAKYFNNQNRIKETVKDNRLMVDFKTYRKTIGDVCDFCLPKVTYIRIYRSKMYLRKYGYKFACSGCFDKIKKDGLKGKKIIVDYRHFIKYK